MNPICAVLGVGAERDKAAEVLSSRPDDEADPPASEGRRAPLVTLISGRGGVGKMIIAASMAWMAAHMGLKAALIDLDLMFGNLHDLMGIEEAVDLCGITGPHDSSFAGTQSVEATAMRVATGLTLWGPAACRACG